MPRQKGGNRCVQSLTDRLASSAEADRVRALHEAKGLACHPESSNNFCSRLLHAQAAPLFMQQLYNQNNAAAADAVPVLKELSAYQSEHQALVSAGLLPGLVHVLSNSSSSTEAQQDAATALQMVTYESPPTQTQLANTEGALAALLSRLTPSKPDALRQAAIMVLAHLAETPRNRGKLAEAGSIVPAAMLLATDNAAMQHAATSVLVHLAQESDIRLQMVDAGALPALVALLALPSKEACRPPPSCATSLATTAS